MLIKYGVISKLSLISSQKVRQVKFTMQFLKSVFLKVLGYIFQIFKVAPYLNIPKKNMPVEWESSKLTYFLAFSYHIYITSKTLAKQKKNVQIFEQENCNDRLFLKKL